MELYEKALAAKKEAESYQDQSCYNAAYCYGYEKGYREALECLLQKLQETAGNSEVSSTLSFPRQNVDIPEKINILTLARAIAEIKGEDVGSYGAYLPEITVKKNGKELYATLHVDKDYPGIDVDCRTEGDNPQLYFLGNFELPNEGTPNISGRLYAGNPKHETDSPVALMVYTDRKENDLSRRVLYIEQNDVLPVDDDSVLRYVGTVAEM